MKNPATAAARIYVGSLSKTTVADDLENLFKKHGTITGMSVNSGFAFVQFETEVEAQDAIMAENGSQLNGRRIIVKQALDKSKSIGNQQQQRGPPQKPVGLGGPPRALPKLDNLPRQHSQNPAVPQKTPPPPNQSEPKQDISFEPPEREPEFQEDNFDDDRPNIRPPPGSGPFNDDRGRRGARKHSGSSGSRGGGPRGRSNDRERFERENFRFEPPPPESHREPFYGRDNYGAPPRIEPFAPPVNEAPPSVPDKNDCEIIVVAKGLT